MFFIIVKISLLWLVVFIQSTQENSPNCKTPGKGLSIESIARAFKKLKISKNGTSLKDAIHFTNTINEIDSILSNEIQLANWNYQTNLTECQKTILGRKSSKYDLFKKNAMKIANVFHWRCFEKQNETLYRWFKLFLKKTDSKKPQLKTHKVIRSLSKKKDTIPIKEIFEQARVCPYGAKREDKSNCTLSFFPDLWNIMTSSRNPKELQSLWVQWRNVTGVQIRKGFLESIEELNKEAKSQGFEEYGELYRYDYEEENFEEEMTQLVEDILPLYKQLHAYVRKKLISYYKDVEIKEDGPIPAHILGNMYAQDWQSIFNIVNPFKDKKLPNVTKIMLKKKMKPIDMFVMADDFFASLGFKRMTPYFWANSMIVKPEDRKVVCHPSAHDFRDGKDFRIKQCTTVNEADLQIVHHEMGHIVYYMLYSKQPQLFRDGASDGFHEAVGEVVTLSASTPEYLEETLFKNSAPIKEDKEMSILHLLQMGLKYIPNAPYTFIIDNYRYKVYKRKIKEDNLNLSWWKERLKYQGVCPPVKRTEKHFDAGAKFHVANDIEYMRYFFANVFAFQIHKFLCKEIDHKGPLHKCNIYKQKKAGNLLRKVLSLGKSKHWKHGIKILTNNENSNLESGPFLEYFKPLSDWLEDQNKDENIGWKSDNPMKCP